MRTVCRKSTPEVRNGRVQKKNSWKPSTDYYGAPDRRAVMIDRKRPGEGYRHLLNKQDIYRFLDLLPDWDNLAVGLNAIVLAPGDPGTAGYHVPGVVHICAWQKDLSYYMEPDFYKEHEQVLNRLGVIGEETDEGDYWCEFDEVTVRDYQLLHILLHELGHHHDRMTTRRQHESGRGEPFAEQYALEYEARIWDAYHRAFRR